MKKIKLLFVQESLTLAGGEKSLIALLSNLNPDKYEIDLQLFKFGGALDEFIPDYVNLLPALAYTQYAGKPWKSNFMSLLKFENISFFRSKISYSIGIRKRKFNHPEKAQIYWECVGNSIQINPKEYDVAIAYAQGVPTFYVIDKVMSKKKIAWVNAKPNFIAKNKVFQKKYYQEFNHIVAVTHITEQQIKEIFPDLSSKILVIEDIVDYNSISKMSSLNAVNFDPNTFNILTVARLNLKSKRYDIALEACRILKEREINFHWYAIGEGPFRPEIEKYIDHNHLQNYFTLLGTKANPYPYFKASNLYVQTSELESYCISIAEARLLNIPVVTTRYDSVEVQMIHEKNGLITDLNPESVAEGIIRIMNDKELYHSIKEYLKSEQKENTETVTKFDEMIEELLLGNEEC